jgi:DNA-binding transcriptional ArsR family regulator
MVVDEVRSGLLQGEVVSHSSDVDNIDDEVVDRIFRALADATRRNILVRTGQGGQSVSALAGYYDMSFAGVQKHVAVLERAGLVAKERRGREQIVRANPPAIRKATELLDAFEQLWTHRTDQMASILAEEGDPT